MRVYLTDTGTDARHPQFQGRVTTGYSAVYGEVADYDAEGHGTHTAGLAGRILQGIIFSSSSSAFNFSLYTVRNLLPNCPACRLIGLFDNLNGLAHHLPIFVDVIGWYG